MAAACVICGSSRLVKSHLLPAAFGRDVKAYGPNMWIGSAQRPGRRLSQSGVFDRFLCDVHERALHQADDYAVDFVRGFALTPKEIETKRFRRDATDNETLVRFACSVLWRFHHASVVEAKHVDLGEWESNMRDVSLGGSVAQAPDVLMFASHQSVMPAAALVLTPARGTHWGEKTLQFILNGLVFTTKLGHGAWPQVIAQAVLNQTPNWIESSVHVWGEKEWRDMKLAADRLRQPRRVE
jgi:hypothetical protein